MSSSISSSRRFAIAFGAVLYLGVAGFCIGSELMIRSVFAEGHPLEQRKADFHQARAPVAAFGDSRFASGISHIGGVANFADTGENLGSILAKAAAFSRQDQATAVILQIDPHQLAIYRLNSDQQSRLDYFLDPDSGPLFMLRPHFRQYLLRYWMAVIEDPSLLNPDDRVSVTEPRQEPSFGEIDPAEQFRRARIRVNLQRPVEAFEETEAFGQIGATIREMRARDVRVCLVSSPTASAYRRAAGAFPVIESFRAAISRLAAKTEVEYFDYSSSLEDRYFSNEDHLNESGAGVFTKMIENDCLGAP